MLGRVLTKYARVPCIVFLNSDRPNKVCDSEHSFQCEAGYTDGKKLDIKKPVSVDNADTDRDEDFILNSVL